MGCEMRELEKIIHRVKLHQLNVLLTVAQTGSMGKAAKQLSLSQPVVSKAIADLESTLGVRLFDRSSQGVEPTNYGRVLVKRSTAMFDDLKTSVGEIKFLADPMAGEITIGCTHSQSIGIVPVVIDRLLRKHPRINFRVLQADAATLVDRDLRERRIELAVTPLPRHALDDDLEATFLYNGRLKVATGLQSPWARRRKVTLADLVDEPWVSPDLEGPTGSMLASAFRANGLALPRIVITSVSDQLVTSMLTTGRYIGALGEAFLYYNIKRLSLRLLPIEIPAQPFPVALVTLKNRTISPVAQLFIHFAREAAKPLPRGAAAATRT
jgi:DNA-binding transcriptional LysR family regulator